MKTDKAIDGKLNETFFTAVFPFFFRGWGVDGGGVSLRKISAVSQPLGNGFRLVAAGVQRMWRASGCRRAGAKSAAAASGSVERTCFLIGGGGRPGRFGCPRDGGEPPFSICGIHRSLRGDSFGRKGGGRLSEALPFFAEGSYCPGGVLTGKKIFRNLTPRGLPVSFC